MRFVDAGAVSADYSGVLEPDDFIFRQIVLGAPITTPATFTLIAYAPFFLREWLIAYRIWQTGDATTFTPHAGSSQDNLAIYRYIDTASPIEDFEAPTGPLSVAIDVTEPDSLVLECAFNDSLSSFTFDAPPGETRRYGSVTGGTGEALADTDGVTVPLGTFTPATWTHSGGSAPPGNTTQAVVVLKTVPVPPLGGWGVGHVRMGAN